MNGLVVKKDNGELVTNSKVIADMLGAKHNDFLRNLEKFILTLDCKKQYANQRPVFTKGFKGMNYEFQEIILTNKMNINYKAYEINKYGFMKMITLVQRYRKASDMVDSFIDAFAMLENYYMDDQKTDKDELLGEIVNKDKHGKKSDVNGLPRVYQVRGYKRSKNGKLLSDKINKTLEETQLNLFTYQHKIGNL